jgi:hypothetical protein
MKRGRVDTPDRGAIRVLAPESIASTACKCDVRQAVSLGAFTQYGDARSELSRDFHHYTIGINI